MYETIEITREGHLTWATLNRPESLNAMNPRLIDEVNDFFQNLPEDRETRVVVLRPEPGNADTCAKLRGLGLEPLAMPVFTVVPVAWTPPDFGGFDAVLLTSANAVRHGALPDTLKALPVIAVGVLCSV